MMTGKKKLSGIYARSIACNWFLEVKKLILSSIMAITVWWRKNQALFELGGNRKIIDSMKSTGKNYNTRRFKRWRTYKSVKVALGPSQKKQMCQACLQSIRGYGQKGFGTIAFVMLGYF
jgi:hypothetical protein